MLEFRVYFECWEDIAADQILDVETFFCVVRDTIEGRLLLPLMDNKWRRVTLREIELTKYEEI